MHLDVTVQPSVGKQVHCTSLCEAACLYVCVCHCAHMSVCFYACICDCMSVHMWLEFRGICIYLYMYSCPSVSVGNWCHNPLQIPKSVNAQVPYKK